MSIASPSDADYSTVIETLRGHIGKGTQPSAYEMRLALAVLKDAISRMDVNTENAAIDAANTALATTGPAVATTVDTQFAILQAFDGLSTLQDVLDAIDAAETAIDADVVAMTDDVDDLDTANTALQAVDPSVPTYVTNVVADG